jgi:hypothetical protein
MSRILLIPALVVAVTMATSAHLWASADEPESAHTLPVGGKFKKGLTIEVTALKRASDNFLRVNLTISNPTGQTVDPELNSFTFWNNSYYVEEGGANKANVAKDNRGEFFASKVRGGTLRPREKVDYWAKFPMPTAGVKKVTFYFEDAEPIEDVPVPAAPEAPAASSKPTESAPQQALASGKFKDGQVIEITGIKRTSDNMLRVNLTIRNPTSNVLPLNTFQFWNNSYYVEEGGANRWNVAKDSRGEPFASRLADIQSGARAQCWVKFGQAGPEVKKASFYFSEAEPIEDVPLPGAAPAAGHERRGQETATQQKDGSLASGKFRKGLMIDVTQLEETADGLLKVTFKIRNPTDQTVNPQLNNFTFWNNLYYVEEGGASKSRVAKGTQSEFDASKLSWRPIGPNESALYWVKFSQPTAGIRKISLYFEDTEPMEDVPIPSRQSRGIQNARERYADRQNAGGENGTDSGTHSSPPVRRMPAVLRGLSPGLAASGQGLPRKKRFVGSGGAKGAETQSDDSDFAPWYEFLGAGGRKMVIEEIERKPDDINEWLDDLAAMIAKAEWVEGDPDEGGRTAALRVLRKHAPTKAKAALRQAQSSSNSNIRAWAGVELQK